MAKPKLDSDVPYHTEQLWALIRTNLGVTDMMYLMAPTKKELWEVIIELKFFGTGHTKQSLEALGFVARKVNVEEVP